MSPASLPLPPSPLSSSPRLLLPPFPSQLQREESARNEAEAKLHTTVEQMEESEKKYEMQLIEKDNEIRQLKEDVSD